MAQSTLHASAGMAVATLTLVRPLIHRWRARLPMARVLGYWILLSYLLGLWATLPSLLRRAGIIAPAAATAWWTNAFVGYGLIERAIRGGTGIGELMFASLFLAQYAAIVACIMHLRREAAVAEADPACDP